MSQIPPRGFELFLDLILLETSRYIRIYFNITSDLTVFS